MRTNDPRALYIYCDGAMDYVKDNPGGIGYIITFPDNIQLEPIPVYSGTYTGGNIERLEIEALIEAMKGVHDLYDRLHDELSAINRIIFITDRFGLREDEKTSVYKIAEWRRNKWKNHEGKPIKNHHLLDELDKTRAKLCKKARSRVHIEYRPRKKNKQADKLAKAGKTGGPSIEKLKKKGEKIGKRKFDGAELSYSSIRKDNQFHVNVFRKDPVQNEWEVWVEICDGEFRGRKLKIYTDDILAKKLKRGNQFIVKVKTVYKHHIAIFRTLKEKKSIIPAING